jgi:hypothetical protein
MDSALSSADAAALDLHLTGCGACQLAAGRMERAWHTLDEVERAITAPDDWARIDAGVEGKGGGRMSPLWLRWQLAPHPAAAACALAVMVALGATGGALVSRAAFAPGRADSIEARALSETFGDLPWGSPATGLAGLLAGSAGSMDTGVPEEKSP